MLRSLIASLHYLSLGIGMGAVFARGLAIRRLQRDGVTRPGLSSLFFADNFWGIAALLWVGTGLARAFGGLEKGTSFYIHNPMFHLKMGLFLIVGAVEVAPMIRFIRWRTDLKGAREISVPANVLSRYRFTNDLQLTLIVVMIFVASLMARGIA